MSKYEDTEDALDEMMREFNLLNPTPQQEPQPAASMSATRSPEPATPDVSAASERADTTVPVPIRKSRPEHIAVASSTHLKKTCGESRSEESAIGGSARAAEAKVFDFSEQLQELLLPEETSPSLTEKVPASVPEGGSKRPVGRPRKPVPFGGRPLTEDEWQSLSKADRRRWRRAQPDYSRASDWVDDEAWGYERSNEWQAPPFHLHPNFKEISARGGRASKGVKKPRKFHLTEHDKSLLAFLVKFPYASANILRLLCPRETSEGRTGNFKNQSSNPLLLERTIVSKLERLAKQGLVHTRGQLIGTRPLWSASPKGHKMVKELGLLDREYPVVKLEKVSATELIGHNYGVAVVAAHLINGSHAVLGFHPSWRVSINDFTLEGEYKSAFFELCRDENWTNQEDRCLGLANWKLHSPSSTQALVLPDTSWLLWDRLHSSWMKKQNLRGDWVGAGYSSELPNGGYWRIPDLVLTHPETGESMALEIENSIKSKRMIDGYVQKYHDDFSMPEGRQSAFAGVVWIVKERSMIQEYKAASKSFGIEDLMDVVPFLDVDGQEYYDILGQI